MRDRIRRLETELEDERKMGYEMFVQEEVSKICEKALVSFEMQQVKEKGIDKEVEKSKGKKEG